METDFFGFTVTFILLGLVVFSFYSLISFTQYNNGATDNILNDPSINSGYDGINTSLNQYLEDTQDSEETLKNSSIVGTTSGTQNVFVESVGGFWQTLKGRPIAIYQSIVSSISTRLPASYNIYFSVFGGIIILAGIVGVLVLITSGRGGK